MLASGRPVIAAAAAHTPLARIVEQCGIVAAADDAREFEHALRELLRHEIARHTLGAAARRYAEQHLHKENVLRRYEEQLGSCVADTSGRVLQRVRSAG
jgi:colanic acid biosynthesis glycosyl transferase WcaI